MITNNFGAAAALVGGTILGMAAWLIGDAAATLADATHTDVKRVQVYENGLFWYFTKDLYNGEIDSFHSLRADAPGYISALRRQSVDAILYMARRSPSVGEWAASSDSVHSAYSVDSAYFIERLSYLSSSGRLETGLFKKIALNITGLW
jgi:hypothetical protein